MFNLHGRAGSALLWIFILSGFAGLIYQSIWTQYLGLFLGHSSYAQSLVLMLFMGGMAIGAWLVSRRSAALRRPLLVYALIEIVVGVLGLSFDGIFHLTTGWAYDQLMPHLTSAQLQIARWMIATALVLPQCILLGATFPLMSAGYMRLREHAAGRVLAGLYFSNSLGAALGALLSTYLMLPAVGLPGTVFTAGLLNLLVAVLVYPISKREQIEVASEDAETSAAAIPSGRSRYIFVLMVAALTGASSFVYEITWIRMLSLALGTTIHSFELMLSAFILGIAFGGLWLKNRADRLDNPLHLAGWVQIWMGLAALVSMFVYAEAFQWVGWLMKVIARTADGYGLFNLASAVIALLVMFPAAFFAGMTLPLLTLSLLRSGQGEKVIGQTYAYNTVGAIVGVLAAVHLLMPLLGLKYALLAAAIVDIGLGLVLIWRALPHSLAFKALCPAAVISIAGVAASVVFVKFDPVVMNASVYRHGTTSLGEQAEVLFSKDGATASVAVFEVGDADYRTRMIATNGKVDAGLVVDASKRPVDDELTMTLLAAIPLALKENYERVGVIGFGSGMTTHALMGHPGLKSVDTVEIEPAMVEGARHLGKSVERAFLDPRSHVVIDDAKSYFASVPQKYDLIISEPSNPWVGGTATLFSTEFYDFVPKQLNEGGLFVQWLQLYEITPTLVNSVLSAMLANFSDVHAYLAQSGDLILVASPRGDVPELKGHVFDHPLLAADLTRIGVPDLRGLRDTQVLDRRGLEAYLSLYPHQINSDMFPVLKLQAPVARFARASVPHFNNFGAAPWPIVRVLGGPAPRTDDELAAEGRMLPIAAVRKSVAAHEILARLTGRPVKRSGDMSEFDSLQVTALEGMATSCTLGDRPARDATVILSLAMETVAFLPASDLQELWIRPAWLDCEPSDETTLAALGLVAAASRNDHPEVIRLGQELFDGKDGVVLKAEAVSSQYILGAMLYATLAMEQSEAAEALVERYWDEIAPSSRSSVSLRLLGALSVGSGEPKSDGF